MFMFAPGQKKKKKRGGDQPKNEHTGGLRNSRVFLAFGSDMGWKGVRYCILTFIDRIRVLVHLVHVRITASGQRKQKSVPPRDAVSGRS
jgi:hypothetical protein